MNIRMILFSGALVLLAACAEITPEYSEPREPEDQLARIETKVVANEGSTLQRVFLKGSGLVTAVDGVSTSGVTVGSVSLLVEPGNRELEVQFRTASGSTSASGEVAEVLLGTPGAFTTYTIFGTTEVLNVFLEAGQKYEIVFERKGSTVLVQMFEEGDGSPVSPVLSSEIGYLDTIN